MRLIDADALMKTIRTYDYPLRSHFNSTDNGMFTIGIQQVVDEQPTIDAVEGWIPCSERLPENDGGMYLVTDYCEQINRRRIHISYCYVNREGFWSDIPIGYKVLAWMPLPEPYREVEE